jgi:penicillin-binding protein 2
MNNFFERRFVIQIIFIIAMVSLITRLFYIQIIDKTYFMESENNVLRKLIIYPSRGIILDRKGKILVENIPVYDLLVIPKEVKDFDTTTLCNLLGVDKTDFIERFQNAKENSPRKPFIIEKQLSSETYAHLQERLYAYKGFFVQNRTVRFYPEAIAAQLLGYVGEVDDKIIKKQNGFYKQGDYIGLSGLEGSYEKILRGQRGVRNVLFDVHNVEKGSYENGKYDTVAVSGEKLMSTINADLQTYGEKLMHNKLGSIVCIEPGTGEILALISSPTYNPNLLVGRERGHNFSKLYVDPYIPLYMRPLQAYYPPGSTIKPVQALIGQEEKLIFPSTIFPGGVGYYAGNHLVKNFHPIPALDLKNAIRESSNSYFCHVFHDIIEKGPSGGITNNFLAWRNYMNGFGFGNPLGIDLPNEKRGRVPTLNTYDKVHGKGHWNSNTIISLAIGQGELDVTPLQMANEMSTIANKGFYYIPHLIKAIGKKEIIKPIYTEKHNAGIDSGYFNIVMEGMQMVVEQGTGRAAEVQGIHICAKTGTAQNPHGEDHSVFVAFAPRENPKIAISVIVENGGQGAHWAAPIAGLMIEKYLRDSISKGRKPYEKRMLEGSVLPPVDHLGRPIPKTNSKDSLKPIAVQKIKFPPKSKKTLEKNDSQKRNTIAQRIQ